MLKYWLWLTQLPGLSNPARLALLDHFGTPEQIFCADMAELALVEGLTQKQAASISHDLSAADRILADCQRLNLRILTIRDGEYPQRLANIYNPPCLLYVKGRLPDFDEEAAIAVVGTRKCTPYGSACAEKLAYDLTQAGAVVVTGLAEGIDAAAARGALRAGGMVAGVLGCGLDVCYPWKNRELYEDTAAAGVLLSEYPPGTRADGSHFPVRNRIMSGLSVAALVVEAPARSGALITASLALEQGREVFAVPGPINAPASAGCNRLIRDGAGLVHEARDLLWEYEEQFPHRLHLTHPASWQDWKSLPQPLSKARPAPRPKPEDAASPPPPPPAPPAADLSGLTDDQAALLRTLELQRPIQVDDLIQATGIPARRVLSALTILEISGLIRPHSGKRYTRTVQLETKP